jgi:hypothetical protein
MYKSISRAEKLEQVMRLQEYQQNHTADETQDKEQAGFSNHFYRKVRLVFCLFLFTMIFLYHFMMEPEEETVTKELQTAIQKDYSEQVIDFVKDFTYTLDYEKISIK